MAKYIGLLGKLKKMRPHKYEADDTAAVKARTGSRLGRWFFIVTPLTVATMVPYMARSFPAPDVSALQNTPKKPAIWESYDAPSTPTFNDVLDDLCRKRDERAQPRQHIPSKKAQETLPAKKPQETSRELQKTIMHNIESLLKTRGNKKGRDYINEIADSFSKLSAYDDYIENACNKYGVAKELAYSIASVEANGSINAFSRKGAAGLMQLMPRTADNLGIEITSTVDERLNPRLSIDHGLKYFSRLLRSFGNEPYLALIAYNMGPTSLNKKIKRYGKTWKALKPHLPVETRNYVIKTLSRMQLFADAGKYNLEIDQMPLYSAKLEDSIPYQMKKGDTISKIAREYDTSIAEIKAINPHIKDPNLLDIGDTVSIPGNNS